ncbi:MAG: L-ascorbate metabolism protein UlaG (beta-lactamase superfamily) [Pseudohongiellaceae bacterium]|jgi:L-ascorbate metabolism protein UlaG (beta-lactamase superfamily)
MKFKFPLISLLALLVFSFSANAQMLNGSTVPTSEGDLVINPVSHASFIMSWNGKIVYVDPVGGVGAYDGLPRPDLILLTDIHADHLDGATLAGIVGNAEIVAPAAVLAQLPGGLVERAVSLPNGGIAQRLDITVKAIPMYNLTEDRLQFHDKGRGNGYVVTFGDTRVYISGDTEDIPEMRALEDIDVAFICFNLPYTMTERQAADAVNAFRPGIVYPYHYRGSDLALFSNMVDEGIEVRNGNWY